MTPEKLIDLVVDGESPSDILEGLDEVADLRVRRLKLLTKQLMKVYPESIALALDQENKKEVNRALELLSRIVPAAIKFDTASHTRV